MVRCNKEAKYSEKKMFDGAGMARMRLILESNAEMYDKGRVFNHLYLDPGCEVGWHIHHGDGETYYILKGHGEWKRNLGSDCSDSLQVMPANSDPSFFS